MSKRAGSLRPAGQGNRALRGSNWAAVRHCFNRRDHEWFSLGSGGQKNYMPVISAHFRSFSATSGHFQPLPPIFAIWCPDRLAVSGDLKIGTAFNTAFRLEIRHEAWQEPSVIKTRLPWPAGEVRALWLSSKARRCNQQNALESAALRRRGVRQRCGRNQVCNEVCHFAGRAGPLASRLPRRGGVFCGTFWPGNESF